MMRLTQFRRPNKKPLLILAGIALGMALLSAGGWWYMAYRATNDYRSQVGSYFEATKKELKTASDQFKALAKEGDPKKSVDALGKLHDSLAKQAGSLPKLPQLFGITLTPQEDVQKRGEITQRLKQLGNDATAAKELLAYQDAAALALQDVTTKTGANADQQKALADAWNVMVGKLQAIRPPAEAQGTHQQIIEALQAAQAQIATLPDLFTKKDVAGFAAKQKEIETHINSLRGLADGMQVLNKNQDKAIARDYQRLLEILK